MDEGLKIVKQLDLTGYIEKFEGLLARPKPLFIEGDRALHFRFIRALEDVEFKAPPKVKNLDELWMRLGKQGVLGLDEIFEAVKVVRYFRYLKNIRIENELGAWLGEIDVPEAIVEIDRMFDEKGQLADSVDERLASLKASMKQNREAIRQTLSRMLNSSKLGPYLVDRQIHYVNDEEALLVRGGFNHVMKGTVIGRTTAGFFYVLPEAISKLKEKESGIVSRLEEVYYEIARKTSQTMAGWLKFWRFIDKAFDRFDHYQARMQMARLGDLSFVLPGNGDAIKLADFAHPALAHPKPVTIDFSKDVLMITGVNAGGKTMLLKSILASAWLAKYLLPMKCDAKKSKIGSFKTIEAIIEDPQNVKNDISTFAGRMRQFSRLFSQQGVLVGVDEIELGTDSDEAASLFKVMIEELVKRKVKIVITTHHKRLAAMMAGDDRVELVAAVYDEKNQRPTYTFLQGIIGKSYAFETAERYGVPKNIVAKARIEYGEDKERLNELIERSSTLEKELREKREQLEREIEALEREKARYKELNDTLESELYAKKRELEAIYREATKQAREALKQKDEKAIHRQLNRAHKTVQKAKIEAPKRIETFAVGDQVKYRKNRGTIIALKAKEATIEIDGMKLRVPLSELKRSGNPPKAPKKKQATVSLERSQASAGVKLDLHGLRAEEAIERLDKFLSDALLAGFDEVLVYHGIGTGRLAHAVRSFLKEHPSVKGFHDAPQHMGGFGATVIEL
ncbi:endonuclease MutS2 [Hydrogenimonas cancrithermarum]|uniref:Endonuclease MutS2 n=1 Tax=Hydrogenimonas cancrithermarum TaxID=2993563 RepID=A0ABN6WWS4_9BACT|nr:endonuclease MutS2 [Hydrogenimonas cancrithermarum]BDY13624.1 endonuclease MutS2 [Hydrogenimonas cancrithermarum]